MFKTIFYLFFLLWGSAYCGMPIFHVILAEKWIENNECFNQEEKQKFIVGTLFPDIRYISSLSRKETHFFKVSIEDIKNEPSPFKKGQLLHSYLDEKREEYVEKNGIYDEVKKYTNTNIATFLKFLEDEMLFEIFDDSLVVSSLYKYEEEEKEVPDQTMRNWHFVLLNYFHDRPSDNLWYMSKIKNQFFNVPYKDLYLWSQIIPQLSNDKFFRDYMDGLMRDLNNKIASF